MVIYAKPDYKFSFKLSGVGFEPCNKLHVSLFLQETLRQVVFLQLSGICGHKLGWLMCKSALGSVFT